MNDSSVLLIGNGQITRLQGPRGVTPPCEDAKFKRGDVVRVRNKKSLAHFPRELVVGAVVPPRFSPDHALADMLGEPRPLMCQVGRRCISYILVAEGDPKPYLTQEANLLPSGKDPVEFEVSREGAGASS